MTNRSRAARASRRVDREQARSVLADGLEDPVAHPPVEVLPHRRVDVVLARPVGRRHVELVRALRRRLTVVLVEGPRDHRPVTRRPRASRSKPLPLEPVEVLHPQPSPVARPPGELGPRQAEARRRVDRLDPAPLQLPGDEARPLPGRSARRPVPAHRARPAPGRRCPCAAARPRHPARRLCAAGPRGRGAAWRGDSAAGPARRRSRRAGPRRCRRRSAGRAGRRTASDGSSRHPAPAGGPWVHQRRVSGDRCRRI